MDFLIILSRILNDVTGIICQGGVFDSLGVSNTAFQQENFPITVIPSFQNENY